MVNTNKYFRTMSTEQKVAAPSQSLLNDKVSNFSFPC